MKRSIPWLLLGLGLVGYGCDSVTSPSAQIPNVAGAYSGPVAWAIGGAPAPPLFLYMNVAQVGSQLTITGTMVVEGKNVPLTAMTGNVNASGYFSPTSGGASSSYDPTCGNVKLIDGSLTFSSSSAQYVEHDATDFCGNWTLSGTLTK